MGVIFLDFTKAFDTVSHSILLDKLASCEINKFVLCWAMNQLNDRAHRNAVDGIQLVGSNSSVLHSSALGIALFSIFINDLEAGVECIFSKLIDDTEMGGTVDPLLGQEALQDDLD